MSNKDLLHRLGCRQSLHGIHDPQICPNIKLKAVSEVHNFVMTSMTHLTRVTVSEGLDRGLRLNSSLACQLLQNF